MTHVMVKGSNTWLEVSGVRAVLSWTPGPGVPDVDACVLLLGPDGRVRGDADFVFYNEPRHPSGLARHLPKKRVAEGLTDTVEVDLAALDASVARVVVAASCDGGPFQLVHGLTLRLYDTAAPQAAPVVSFDLVPDTGRETALICGELYRKDAGWKFRALGQGYISGLVALATEFGISVDDSDQGQPPVAHAAAPGTPAAPPATPEPVAPESAPTALVPTATEPQPEPEPASAYGYPLQAPSPAHVPAQPAYGYPQPYAAAPPPTSAPTRPGPPQGAPYAAPWQPQPPAPSYGYPQAGYGYPPPATVPAPPAAPPAANTDDGFVLPPQGPQFQPGP